jgi:hypothetical protein
VARQRNYPDRALLDELTDAQRNAVIDGAGALKELQDFKRRSFDAWMTVARGIAPLCELAARPGTSRKARKNLLKDNGYGSLNEGTVSRLLLMARHETAIRIWRDTLTQNQRDGWNAPTSICNRCPAVRAAMAEAAADRPPRKPRNPSKLHLEAAIDAIVDGAAELAMDERMAILTRIADGLGIATRKQRSRARKAKTGLKQAEDNINAALGKLTGG